MVAAGAASYDGDGDSELSSGLRFRRGMGGSKTSEVATEPKELLSL